MDYDGGCFIGSGVKGARRDVVQLLGLFELGPVLKPIPPSSPRPLHISR